jgi:hypothetical protein
MTGEAEAAADTAARNGARGMLDALVVKWPEAFGPSLFTDEEAQ